MKLPDQTTRATWGTGAKNKQHNDQNNDDNTDIDRVSEKLFHDLSPGFLQVIEIGTVKRKNNELADQAARAARSASAKNKQHNDQNNDDNTDIHGVGEKLFHGGSPNISTIAEDEIFQARGL